jgi:H+/Cl- antiporter ClcA
LIQKIGVLGALFGALTSMYSAWFIVRGPFFGYQIPPRWMLLTACGSFVLGLIIFALGVNIASGMRTSERPDIDEQQDHTMDWIQR